MSKQNFINTMSKQDFIEFIILNNNNCANQFVFDNKNTLIVSNQINMGYILKNLTINELQLICNDCTNLLGNQIIINFIEQNSNIVSKIEYNNNIYIHYKI